jgi:hypothetical protein
MMSVKVTRCIDESFAPLSHKNEEFWPMGHELKVHRKSEQQDILEHFI